jgi:hypothetical protein
MFVLLDVRVTGLAAGEFARRLLDSERVAVLPATASARAPRAICALRSARRRRGCATPPAASSVSHDR